MVNWIYIYGLTLHVWQIRAAEYTAANMHIYVHVKKHMPVSFEHERYIKNASPLVQAPLIFQMINDGLTKQALDKC